MTVRFFVTSASLMIFCWLAATFFLAVPMETYPDQPARSSVSETGKNIEPTITAARSEDEPSGISVTPTTATR